MLPKFLRSICYIISFQLFVGCNSGFVFTKGSGGSSGGGGQLIFIVKLLDPFPSAHAMAAAPGVTLDDFHDFFSMQQPEVSIVAPETFFKGLFDSSVVANNDAAEEFRDKFEDYLTANHPEQLAEYQALRISDPHASVSYERQIEYVQSTFYPNDYSLNLKGAITDLDDLVRVILVCETKTIVHISQRPGDGIIEIDRPTNCGDSFSSIVLSGSSSAPVRSLHYINKTTSDLTLDSRINTVANLTYLLVSEGAGDELLSASDYKNNKSLVTSRTPIILQEKARILSELQEGMTAEEANYCFEFLVNEGEFALSEIELFDGSGRNSGCSIR